MKNRASFDEVKTLSAQSFVHFTRATCPIDRPWEKRVHIFES